MVLKQAGDSGTNPFERSLKELKAVDKSMARHHREDHNATLFVKMTREERSRAMRLDGFRECLLPAELSSDSDSDSDCVDAPASTTEPRVTWESRQMKL